MGHACRAGALSWRSRVRRREGAREGQRDWGLLPSRSGLGVASREMMMLPSRALAQWNEMVCGQSTASLGAGGDKRQQPCTRSGHNRSRVT